MEKSEIDNSIDQYPFYSVGIENDHGVLHHRILFLDQLKLIICGVKDKKPIPIPLFETNKNNRYTTASIHVSAISAVNVGENGKITLDLCSDFKAQITWLDKDPGSLLSFLRRLYAECAKNRPIMHSRSFEPALIADEEKMSGILCDLHELPEQYGSLCRDNFVRILRYHLSSFGVLNSEELVWYLRHSVFGSSNRCISLQDRGMGPNEMCFSILMTLPFITYFREVEMKRIRLTNDLLELLGKVLQKCTLIQTLRISDCSFQINFAETLGKTLNYGIHLQELELSHIAELDDQGIRAWRNVASLFGSRLRVLRLNGCNVTLNGVDSLASTILATKEATQRGTPETSLRELDLSDNPLGNEKPQGLCTLLRASPDMRILRMARCNTSLYWLPGVLIESCQNSLNLLDISGNSFGRSAYTEWSTLFSGTTALETLRLDNCHGPHSAETLRHILTGLGRLKRRDNGHALRIELTNLNLDTPMDLTLSSALKTAVTSVVTHLDLSRFDFADTAPDVLRNLECCITLEVLIVNGPWINTDNSAKRAIVQSLSMLLKNPNCRIHHLSVADVGLKNDVLYLIGDLLNYTSLRHLDISGNQFGSVSVENGSVGDGAAVSGAGGSALPGSGIGNTGSPTVARILARVLAASDQLSYLAFDNNDLSLYEIEDLVHVAEHYRQRLILATPLCDLAQQIKMDSEKCKQLIKRIEDLHHRNLYPSLNSWWEKWENGEELQATIQCLDRLCMNTRQLQEMIKSPIESTSETADLEVDTKKWLVDGVRTQILLHEFTKTVRDLNGEFLKQVQDLTLERLQSGIENHLDNLSVALHERVKHLCPNQGESCPSIRNELLNQLHNSISSSLCKMISDIIIPELESKLNAVTAELTSAMYDAIAGNVINGLDQAHRTLIKRIRPKSFEKPLEPRIPIRTRWLEAREAVEDPPRSYPTENYLTQIATGKLCSVPLLSPTNTDDLLRFRGLEDMKLHSNASPSFNGTNNSGSGSSNNSNNDFLPIQPVSNLPALPTQHTYERNSALSPSGAFDSVCLPPKSSNSTPTMALQNTQEVGANLSPTMDERLTKPLLIDTQQKSTSLINVNREPEETSAKDLKTRRLQVGTLSPKLNLLRLEPVDSSRSLRIRRSTRIPLETEPRSVREELIQYPANYRTTLVSQFPRFSIDDELNDARSGQGPRRGSSEPSLWWEEKFLKELYYTPCIAGSSEWEENEDVPTSSHGGAWNTPPIRVRNQTGLSPTEPKSILTPTKPVRITEPRSRRNWSSVESPSGTNFPSSCPEDKSTMERFSQYGFNPVSPQRQRSSPSMSYQSSRYIPDIRHSTMPRTIVVPELSSGNYGKVESLTGRTSKRESSKHFARLKLFFEENSSSERVKSPPIEPRSKTRHDRRRTLGEEREFGRVSTSSVSEEGSDTARVVQVGRPVSGSTITPMTGVGHKTGPVTIVEIKRNPLTATSIPSRTPLSPPITIPSKASAEPVQILGTLQQTEQPAQIPSSVATTTVLSTALKEDRDYDSGAAPSLNHTTRDNSAFSSKTKNEPLPLAPKGKPLEPKLGYIGGARPKRPKTRAGRFPLARSASAMQATDTELTSMDEDLFQGSSLGWGMKPEDGVSSQPYSRSTRDHGGKYDSLDETDAERLPDQATFKVIAGPTESDVDTDGEEQRPIPVRGIPMPGLVGPKASSILAAIKQKTLLRPQESRPKNPKPVEANPPMNELQRAISSLRSSKAYLRPSDMGTEPVSSTVAAEKPLLKRS